MNTDTLLAKLQKVRKTSKGWVACCPAHEDRTPSLSITEAGGAILLKCFAGCEFPAICKALNVSQGDLCADAPNDTRKQVATPPRTAQAAPFRTVDTYVYNDETGVELYRIDRLENGTDKTFRQYRMVEGRRVKGIGDVRRVLWRLPMLATVEDVCLVEGEKCVKALESVGIQATTAPGGANGWRDEMAASLTGKHLWVCPDNDAAGARWLKAVCDSLDAHGIEYHIVFMPDCFQDVADLTAAHDTPKHALYAITKLLCEAERNPITLKAQVTS